MAAEHQDWVDRTMAQSAWEPPDGFTDRVVLQAMAALPPRKIPTFSRAGMRATVTGFRDSMLARFEMSMWVLTQYRELLFRSG
jgi:hypothetical protein